MQKHLKPFSFIMVCLLLIVSCQEPDGIDKLQDEATMSLRTVDAKEVSIDFKKKNQNKSANWITPYFQFTDSIPLINSNAQITVTPVITTLPDAYSRLFSIEIDGNLETVVYHMFANDQSTDFSFWGRAVITDVNGEVLSAWDIEDNIFTNYYDFTGVQNPINILNYSASTTNKNGGDSPGEGNDGPCVESSDPDDWVICGPEVTITAPGSGGLSAGIKIIYHPEFTLGDDESIGGSTNPSDTIDDDPAAEAGSLNQNGCPPGQIKDDNDNCIDAPEPCPDINMIRNNDNVCECKSGFTKDKNGKCVQKPCDNDPVKDPKVASQKVSGINGGRYGCTRNRSSCDGITGKKKHAGLDILNPYGAPVFAMFDGTATSVNKEFTGAGWIVYQTATVNGNNISIQYFHLQKENRTSGTIKAGDIIGYQGDSGNLAGAIKKGGTSSHLHIKFKDSSGNTLDPEDYIGSLSSDSNDGPTISNNNCN